MPKIEWTGEEKAREWGFAKEKLINEGKLLPDGHKLRRKDYSDILTHSFMVIDRQMLALSGKGIYLGEGINGHVKLTEDERSNLIALKVITNEDEGANSADESKVAQDLGVAGQRVTRISSSKKHPVKHYIAYQFLGIRLFKYLNEYRASLDNRYEAGINIALALNELHTGKKSKSKKPYIHGDVHGKNIVIDKKGTPHFIDFGRTKCGEVAYGASWRNDIVQMLHVFFTPFENRVRWYKDWIFGDWIGEYQFAFYPPPEEPSKQMIYIYLNPGDMNESGLCFSIHYAVFDPFVTFQNRTIQLDDVGLPPLSFKEFQKEEYRIESMDSDIKKLLEKKVRDITNDKGYTTSIKKRNEVLFDLLKKPTDFLHSRDTPTALDVAEILTLCRLGLEKYQSTLAELSADARLKIIHNLNSVSGGILNLYEILNTLSQPVGHSDLIKSLIVFYCFVLDEKVLTRKREELNVVLNTLTFENASLIRASLDKVVTSILSQKEEVRVDDLSQALEASPRDLPASSLSLGNGVSKIETLFDKTAIDKSYTESITSSYSFFKKSCTTQDQVFNSINDCHL